MGRVEWLKFVEEVVQEGIEKRRREYGALRYTFVGDVPVILKVD